ncbi:methyltransferase domain-containing protein [Amylocystis lapponica]|nr:methyltransferase domain-containing protein [Amylocystis lapponica]
MAHGFSMTRHPRYAVFLIVCGLVTVFLISRPAPVPYFSTASRGASLKGFLLEEDAHYSKVVHDREAMVRKYGPSPSQIESFPLRDTFYTLWDYFIPAFQCPHRVERVGTMGDGGKWMCGLDRIARQSECVVYSFGLNGESSFEAEILTRAPGCQVWGYDFSVTSFGPEIENNPRLAGRAHFHPWALGGTDSYGPSADPPFYTLHTLMEMNGHSFIDILKIDIEGGEFETLDRFVDAFAQGSHGDVGVGGRVTVPGANALPIGQLQLEIHARSSEYASFPVFKRWWEKLEAAGLRPFMAEPNLVYVNLVRGVPPDLAEYSFMNIRGEHALVSDGPH